MPIDLNAIPLQPLGLLAGLAFISSLIGHTLTRNALLGAVITVIVFVAIYIGWNFYPHGLVPGIRFPG
ncbi:MAG: hypothetical protein NW223_09300 [Hyphomicrobiaceae bacterium]|nr:hypothetical protein [Hyphomicrobiaceae bacterium]